ncbi:F-box protein cpr30 [Phtheirospermum japonicum]|uniref:F-box protein cpr30 n=1 Tax=Phtheirospermum japonicum TaxID=374723 RepID=A0A830CK19_9LAMI|nr:F-box protein cpr30 [Phtheirospermum japonicum]
MATCALPENIVLCILTRLPVKSIARFKSVCKPWRHLFSTPEFLKSHQSQFSSDPKNQSLIVHRVYKNSSDTSFFNIESNAMNPSAIDYRNGDIVGCCNGLVCVNYGKVIVLLNPATMMFSRIAPSSLEGCGPLYTYERVSLGFGYDAEGNDFKVVRFFRLKENQKHESIAYEGVEVYSGNSGSWTTIGPGFWFRVLTGTSPLIVNGNPYWLAEVDQCLGDYLVCFDVRELVFRTVPISSFDLDLVDPLFVEWRGSLGVLVSTIDDDRWRGVKSLDVWVFDDGEQIWRKNRTFVGPCKLNVDLFLACSKNGRVVGKCPDGKLFMFDTETGFANVLFNGARQPKCVEVYPYAESLAYIKGMKPVGVATLGVVLTLMARDKCLFYGTWCLYFMAYVKGTAKMEERNKTRKMIDDGASK